MKTSELLGLGRRLASTALSEAGFHPPPRPGPVSLDGLAGFFGVRVSRRQDGGGWGTLGALWSGDDLVQGFLFRDAREAEIYTSGVRHRFALAHELAHRLAEIYLSPELREEIQGPSLERLVDECASRLLLPDPLLAAAARSWPQPLHLTVPWLQENRRRLGVSISCLVKRLSDACIEGHLEVDNGGLVAAPSVSRRRRVDYAPRVVASCLPRGWFIPTNKRLSTLGLQALSDLFWRAEPFVLQATEEALVLQRRHGGRWTRVCVRTCFECVVYQRSADQGRLLLAVFSFPPDS